MWNEWKPLRVDKRRSSWNEKWMEIDVDSTQNFQSEFDLLQIWDQSLKFSLLFLCFLVNAVRVKRQSDDKKSSEEYEQELCKDKDAGEWFRLVANDGDSCRDVIQCTTSVRIENYLFRPTINFWYNSPSGITSNSLSCWSIFWHWEANLRLEGCCQKLQAQK